MPQEAGKTVVGLGESLFDCFSDRTVLGGAPLNVALHANSILRASGGRGLPASRIGYDPLGNRLLHELRRREVSTEAIQLDAELPTGRVQVGIGSNAEATYRFDDTSAWDVIEFSSSLKQLAESCAAVTFGTLGQRAEHSRRSIREFLGCAHQAIRLFDVNLRQDYYNAEVLDTSLRIANAVKLNDQEARQVARKLALADAECATRAIAESIFNTYQLHWIAVTHGSRGAEMLLAGKWHHSEPPRFASDPDADSVGAGDAFCAALLCGCLFELPPLAILDTANKAGAYVASKPGATPELPEEMLTSFR